MTRLTTVIHDTAGPVWSRWPYTLLGATCLAIWASMPSGHGGFFGSFGLALLMLSPLVTGRRAKRKATIELQPGAIVVRDASFLNQTIETRAVTGASAAAREGGGITLALARGKSKNPVLLELADEAELKAVRDALGIRHQGFGELRWQTSPRAVDVHDAGARLVTGLALLFSSAAYFIPTHPLLSAVVLALSVLLVPLTILVVVLNLAKLGVTSETLTLTPNGVSIQRAKRTVGVPYGEVQRVIVNENAFAIARPLPAMAEVVPSKPVAFLPRGLSADERTHLLSQIYSAMSRAHGQGAQHIDPTERVETLRRTNESTRQWLTRIDVAAGTIVPGAGYRGGVIEEHELWAIAEDHDVATDARAAALRMLTRIAPTNVRVKTDAILASVHDDTDRKRMRVALEPDLEEAAREIDLLDELPAQGR
ncbi:MAG: hypothetical protein JWM74_6242 [Myxococcaceae bacterium]|nr:hypothetical protein [Myxococcaceae bacterium]